MLSEEWQLMKWVGIFQVMILLDFDYFSYGVEIFPHPLVKLIGHVSPYMHRDVNLSSNMYF